MKLKKCSVFLFFLYSLKIFCDEISIETIENELPFRTVLEEAKSYFSDINWTESKSIFPTPMAEPFVLENVTTDNLNNYSDTDLQENLFPSLDGIGILDYTGIESSVLIFLNSLSYQLKNGKIEPVSCSKEKGFLPYLINYRLNFIKPINSVFYARPEYIADRKVKTKFRCSIKDEDKIFYCIIEITLTFIEERWYIDSFDIIEDKI